MRDSGTEAHQEAKVQFCVMLKSKWPQIRKVLEFKPAPKWKPLVSISNKLVQLQVTMASNIHFVGHYVQVKPGVCSVGVQCSESQIQSCVQDVGVQCSLMAPVRHSTFIVLPCASSPLPSDVSQSESEMSQGDFEIPDLDTSAYTIQDDSSS